MRNQQTTMFQESNRTSSRAHNGRSSRQHKSLVHINSWTCQFPLFMARSPFKTTKESDVTPHVEENLDSNEDTLRAKAELYKNQGNDEYRRKEFSNAEKLYTKGLKVNCKDDELNAKLYNNRATAHFYLGNYHESLDDAKAATDLQSNYIKAIERGASACVKLHLYEEAIIWCNKGLAIYENNRTLLDLKRTSVDVVSKLPDLPDQEESNSESETVEGEKSENSIHDELGNFFLQCGNYEAAIHYYVRQLKTAQQLGDRAGQRRAHYNLGSVYFKLGNFKATIRYYERDLEISTKMKYKAGERRALDNFGMAYRYLGDLRRAINCYECSLKISEEVGDRKGVGRTYVNLGIAYQDLGDFQKATDYHERHLKIVKELGDRDGEAQAYLSFGNICFGQGNFTKALEYHEYVLKIGKELGDRATKGAAYGGLGNDHMELGNFKKAIDYHQQHLEITKIMGNRAAIGQVYGNLGTCYENLGEIKTAIDYYTCSLKIAQEVGDKTSEESANGNLGSAFLSLGNFTKAIDYCERQLKIAQEVGRKSGEGKALNNLGNAYLNLRNFEKAKDCLERGLAIHKKLGNKHAEGSFYGNLGIVYYSLDDFKKAIAYHELHLKNSQEFGDRNGEGMAYINLANVYGGLGDIQKAMLYYKVGLEIAKEVGNKDREARSYNNLGCCFEALDNRNTALHFYQSSVNTLNHLRDLLHNKDEWKISLRHLFQTVYNSLWSLLVKQGKVVKALTAAEQGRAQALVDLLELNYGGFERPVSAGSSPQEETMNETLCCLPSNAVFVAVYKREIVFWFIQKGKDVELRRHVISDTDPKVDAITFLQSLIENAREKLGVRAGVRCEDRSLDQLRDDKQSHERSGQTASCSSEIQSRALRKLYDVFIGPIEDLIRESDELTIVPDGPLFLVSFAALMDSESKYLGESFRIRVLPSLTSFKLLAKCPADYHCKTGALLVGDPCVKKIVTFNGGKLSQLESAKEEVEMIGQIINCTPLTGTEATKGEVLRRISSVALVHIAAHGRMETGEIALAPNPVPGSAQVHEEDYLLTMADVLNVKLRARLVVLSCCHSGRGEIKAEGVVGIARAFLGAGARSVLVSLWAIDDEATLLFMKFFYEHLLEGIRASEALKQTMKCMREPDSEFREVKHWAPFVLIGDDVTLDFGGTE